MISRTVATLFVVVELVLFSASAQSQSRSSAWLSFPGDVHLFRVDFSRRAVVSPLKNRATLFAHGAAFTGQDVDYGLMGVDLEPRLGGDADFGRGLPVRFASGGIGLLTNAILLGAKTLEGLGHVLSRATLAERLGPGADIYRLVFGNPEEALEAMALLQKDQRVRFVHPDFRLPIEARGYVDPTQEPLWPQAWHLKKSRIGEAWDKTTGSPSVLVALIDLGFEVDHPDLAGAWAINTEEVPGNRKDDDGNGLVDDVLGWNFGVGGPNLLYGPGPGHGTATAGIIAARANGLGVSGLCPNCRVLPLVIDDQVSSAVAAFLYAKNRGATVISNSWGYRVGTPETEALSEAIRKMALDSRGGKGASVIFAMGNKDHDDCRGAEPDISALTTVIAVSSADGEDKKVKDSGYGSCLAILASSSAGRVQGIVTTDRRGTKGFNTGSERGDLVDLDYTNSFHGTSAAAPQVAGALGLLYSICPQISAKDAFGFLIASADKVRPEEALYDPASGRSLSYGYGRLNVAAMLDGALESSASGLCSISKDEEYRADEAEGRP
jgi:subtilisin family serine protease